MLMMMKLEDTYTRLGELSDMHNKTIVICDRGTMDCCAYTRPAYWSDILARHKLTNVELRDARYDCVIHLVTAAYGAESFYTVDNNAVRLEGISLARELDDKVANVRKCAYAMPYAHAMQSCVNMFYVLCRTGWVIRT